MGKQLVTITGSSEVQSVAHTQSIVIDTSANITTAIVEDGGDAAPLSLAAVIDTSASMSGERLNLAKKTLRFIVQNLKQTDQLSIVTFGSTTEVILPLTTMSSAQKKKALESVDDVRITGATFLSGGLFDGIESLRSAPVGNVCSVMLLTDGEANIGIYNIPELTKELSKNLDKFARPLSVFTFGFGADHSAKMLRAISDTGNGMYYFIEKEATIAKSFAECLGGVSSVVCRNAQLKISLPDKSSVSNIATDLPWSTSGNTWIVNLSDLFSGERRNIPISIKLPILAAPANNVLVATFEVSYDSESGKQSTSCSISVSRPIPAQVKNEISQESVEIDEQRNRVNVANSLKTAVTEAEARKYDAAKKIIQDTLNSLNKSISKDTPFTKGLIEDLEQVLESMRDQATFQRIGIKYMYSLSRSHYQQRASGVTSASAAAYLTDGQRSMLDTLSGAAPAARSASTNTPAAKPAAVAVAAPAASSTSSNSRKGAGRGQAAAPAPAPAPAPVLAPEPAEPPVDQGRLGRGIRRLMHDLQEIKLNPLPSITAEPLERDLFEWHTNMVGPEGNPYSGVVFHIIMQFPHTYPFNPPKLYFCSFLKHDHVFKTWICLDMLQEFEWAGEEQDKPYTGWTTAYSVHSVLLQLQSFLFDKANATAQDIKKAADSARDFKCSGCPHHGAEMKKVWPQFPSIAKRSAKVGTTARVQRLVRPLPEPVVTKRKVPVSTSQSSFASSIKPASVATPTAPATTPVEQSKSITVEAPAPTPTPAPATTPAPAPVKSWAATIKPTEPVKQVKAAPAPAAAQPAAASEAAVTPVTPVAPAVASKAPEEEQWKEVKRKQPVKKNKAPKRNNNRRKAQREAEPEEEEEEPEPEPVKVVVPAPKAQPSNQKGGAKGKPAAAAVNNNKGNQKGNQINRELFPVAAPKEEVAYRDPSKPSASQKKNKKRREKKKLFQAEALKKLAEKYPELQAVPTPAPEPVKAAPPQPTPAPEPLKQTPPPAKPAAAPQKAAPVAKAAQPAAKPAAQQAPAAAKPAPTAQQAPAAAKPAAQPAPAAAQQARSLPPASSNTVIEYKMVESLEFIPLEQFLKFNVKNTKGMNGSLFSFLSDDLIFNILKFVTEPRDLIRVGMVCHDFAILASSDRLWKPICGRFFSITENTGNWKNHFTQEVNNIKKQLFCFHTRKTFEEDILGIPISYERNPRTRKIQFISSTLDLLSREAYAEDNVRKSVWKRPFSDWMPLYITAKHFNQSLPRIKSALASLSDSNGFKPWMVLDVLPKLMNTMVVSVMSGEVHASIVAIEGYCAFHHMLLKMIELYPELKREIDQRIRSFISSESNRHKDQCPNLGEFLPLVSVHDSIFWEDIREAYLQENFDRNALWIIKANPGLKRPDRDYAKGPPNMDRIARSFEANKTSIRLLMFHVYFLTRIARVKGRTLSDVVSNYDLFYGRPTAQMKEQLQVYCKRVLSVQNWGQAFAAIGMNATPLRIHVALNQAIVNSKAKGYHN